MHDDVTTEVQALARLDLDQLRAEWRRRWGVSPTMRSAQLLRHLMAWRLQLEAYGGLDAQTRRAVFAHSTGPAPVALEPGARLAREWRGVRYEVEVVEEGIRYRNQTYASLSEVARVITGTRWNGLRFFGLRNGAEA